MVEEVGDVTRSHEDTKDHEEGEGLIVFFGVVVG